MEIRLATVEDCGEMTELRIAMREERDKEEWLISKEQFKNNSYNYFYKNISSCDFISYVAVCDGKIVAMSGLVFYTVPPLPSVLLNGKAAYLMNMYTAPLYRNRGIATSLLHETVEYAKRQGCDIVNLNSSKMGRPLYEKYGFIKSDNEMRYYLNR